MLLYKQKIYDCFSREEQFFKSKIFTQIVKPHFESDPLDGNGSCHEYSVIFQFHPIDASSYIRSYLFLSFPALSTCTVYTVRCMTHLSTWHSHCFVLFFGQNLVPHALRMCISKNLKCLYFIVFMVSLINPCVLGVCLYCFSSLSDKQTIIIYSHAFGLCCQPQCRVQSIRDLLLPEERITHTHTFCLCFSLALWHCFILTTWGWRQSQKFVSLGQCQATDQCELNLIHLPVYMPVCEWVLIAEYRIISRPDRLQDLCLLSSLNKATHLTNAHLLPRNKAAVFVSFTSNCLHLDHIFKVESVYCFVSTARVFSKWAIYVNMPSMYMEYVQRQIGPNYDRHYCYLLLFGSVIERRQ